MDDRDKNSEYRIEQDLMGEIRVPSVALWGAQTQRSLELFSAGELMPLQVIQALILIKKAAAIANGRKGVLSEEKVQLISDACDDLMNGISDGRYYGQFPIVVYQTGSGTQSNMNVNEVIANLGNDLAGAKVLHPNDDVNKSQSSNDVFPTAMHIASAIDLSRLYGQLTETRNVLQEKEDAFRDIVKTGRTHLQDATPITLGQEFSGYRAGIEAAMNMILEASKYVSRLSIGGTAVGTGLNAPRGFDADVVSIINEELGTTFTLHDNKFHGMMFKDGMSFTHGALKVLAENLLKLANDIRFLASGPKCGIGELKIPKNEPGSSIMPGKVNPTQCEALAMACLRVIGNDVTVGMANSQGHFQLNTYMPLIVSVMLESIELIDGTLHGFTEYCLKGIEADEDRISENLSKNLMLVTALNPHIGYEKAGQIAQKAYKDNISLKEAALELKFMSPEEFDEWVDPLKMTGEHK